MASPQASKLADRMKRPKPTAQGSAAPASVSSSFKEAPEEFPKRLTVGLTEDQHRKFKLYALSQGRSMNQILRDYIDGLA